MNKMILFLFLFFTGSISAQVVDTLSAPKVFPTYPLHVKKGNSIAVLPVLQKNTITRPSYDYKISVVPYSTTTRISDIRPLPLEMDSSKVVWHNYVRLGYGDHKNPSVRLSFQSSSSQRGDIHAYIDGHGIDNTSRVPFQKYYHGIAGLFGKTRLGGSHFFVYDIKGAYDSRYNRAMSVPSEHSFVRGRTLLGFKNINPSKKAWIYKLRFGGEYLNALKNTQELSYLADASLQKRINNKISIVVDSEAHYTSDTERLEDIRSTYISLRPGLRWRTGRSLLLLQADLTLNNKVRSDFVRAYGSLTVIRSYLHLYAGADQKVDINNIYRRYTLNPYYRFHNDGRIATPNTLTKRYYAGVRSTIGDHFSLDIRAGYKEIKDALYFNFGDSGAFTTQYIDYDGKYASLELMYRLGNHFVFNVSGEMDLPPENIYENTLENYQRFTGGSKLTYTAFRKRLNITGEYFYRDKIQYTISKMHILTNPAHEINAEISFTIGKYISLWARGNNLLDRKHQQFAKNPRIGRNLEGGITLHW